MSWTDCTRGGLMNPADWLVEQWPPREQGGQHVLDRSPGVRVTHLPTGLMAASVVMRSQHKNREVALAMIEYGLACL